MNIVQYKMMKASIKKKPESMRRELLYSIEQGIKKVRTVETTVDLVMSKYTSDIRFMHLCQMCDIAVNKIREIAEDVLSKPFKEKDEPAMRQNVQTVKVGRNEPCPCGSGRKYKKCCGR